MRDQLILLIIQEFRVCLKFRKKTESIQTIFDKYQKSISTPFPHKESHEESQHHVCNYQLPHIN